MLPREYPALETNVTGDPLTAVALPPVVRTMLEEPVFPLAEEYVTEISYVPAAFLGGVPERVDPWALSQEGNPTKL